MAVPDNVPRLRLNKIASSKEPHDKVVRRSTGRRFGRRMRVRQTGGWQRNKFRLPSRSEMILSVQSTSTRRSGRVRCSTLGNAQRRGSWNRDHCQARTEDGRRVMTWWFDVEVGISVPIPFKNGNQGDISLEPLSSGTIHVFNVPALCVDFFWHRASRSGVWTRG